MQAFGPAEKPASWAGACPGNHESVGNHKSGKVRKGTPWVRRVPCEAAHAASRTRWDLAGKFETLLVRRGRQRAISALARTLLTTAFALIERGDYQRDASVDFGAMSGERNTPQWIRTRSKCGHIPAKGAGTIR